MSQFNPHYVTKFSKLLHYVWPFGILHQKREILDEIYGGIDTDVYMLVLMIAVDVLVDVLVLAWDLGTAPSSALQQMKIG